MQQHALRIAREHPLIFMHIPKTGGMSLFTALTEHFGPQIADLYNISPRNAGQALRLFADHRKAVYCGHYAFGVHNWFDRPVTYAAVVREPIARLLSLYHYCRPMLIRYGQYFQKNGCSMEGLWKDPELSDFYLDFPAALQGDLSPEAFFSSPSAELDNGMVRRFSGWGINPQQCPDTALAEAKENIERYFSVVGILERYGDTLNLIETVFGFPTLKESRVNKGKQPTDSEPPVPQKVIERIRETNRLDMALYDWIAVRFDEVIANPKTLSVLKGGGRKDPEGVPLWRSVGNSPLREVAMQTFGKQALPVKPLQIVRFQQAAFSERHVQVDLMTKAPSERGQEGGAFETYRLLLTPMQTKKLVSVLGNTVDEYERKHGVIES